MISSVLSEPMQRRVVLRSDVQWYRFSERPRETWVVRDPISLEYYYFSRLEQIVASQLDGTRSLEDVLNEHRSSGITPTWLQQLVGKLENACLCVPRDLSVGKRLWYGSQTLARGGFWRRLLSPMAVRVKLFDPTAILRQLTRCADLLFSRAFVSLWILFGCVIGFLVVTELLQRPLGLLGDLRALTTTRAIGLVVAYICVKSLHELGHALACRKWRAECHEIGLLFLVFTPILYCDVSDSWTLPSRWRRACVAAAGIYVELILATLAGAVWLLTPHFSFLSMMAANVVIICSLNTIVVNANPLLRYDGYYVLSDLWGVPNLSEQGREAAWKLSLSTITAQRLPRERWDANANALAMYGIASWGYRQFVMVVIGLVVWTLLNGMGLSLLAALFLGLMITSVVYSNTVAVVRWVRELSMVGGFRSWAAIRLTALLAGISGCVFAFFTVPLPTHVTGRGLTRSVMVSPLYANQSGTLVSFAAPGKELEAGSELLQIESVNLRMEFLESQSRVRWLQQRVQQLKLLSVDDESAATELANVSADLSKANGRLQLLGNELASLVTTSPRKGKLIVGAHKQAQLLTEPHDSQQVSPRLSKRNIGSYIERGELLGWLSEPTGFDLIAYVVEQDAELLWNGMDVFCRWDCEVGTGFKGTVTRISAEPISEIPTALLGDQSIVAAPDADGILRPDVPHYEVSIKMEQMPMTLGHRSLSSVIFQTSPRTVFQSVKRLFNRHVRPGL